MRGRISSMLRPMALSEFARLADRMKSLLRFLAFVLVAAAGVGALYFWKNGRPAPTAGHPASVVSAKRPVLAALDGSSPALVNQVLPSVVSIEAIPADTTDPRFEMLRLLFGGRCRRPPERIRRDRFRQGTHRNQSPRGQQRQRSAGAARRWAFLARKIRRARTARPTSPF